MANDSTKDFAEAYDEVRKEIGMPGPLQLFALNAGATGSDPGYVSVLTIESGWKAKRTTNFALGQEFFEIKIADVETALPEIVNTKSPSHALIGDRYYQITDIREPKTATRKWLIRCAPTGETKPS